MSDGEKTRAVGDDELREIEAVYDQLGLLTPEARAKFAKWNGPECHGGPFRTTIATTTTPNRPTL